METVICHLGLTFKFFLVTPAEAIKAAQLYRLSQSVKGYSMPSLIYCFNLILI